jgi:hypothetical protein
MADKVPCQGRLCDPASKYRPNGPEGKEPYRYKEKACPGFCVPGSTDPLCSKCTGRKAAYNAAPEAPHRDASWHGFVKGEFPKKSRLEGSPWNIETTKQHQLAQLKAAASAAGGGAAVKAVVKKATAVVNAAEKTKAAAMVAVNRAEAQEEKALTVATANIVARLRQRLQTEAATAPANRPAPAPAPARPAAAAPTGTAATGNIVAKMRERLLAAAAAAAANRPATVSSNRKSKKRSSSEKKRKATRRSSGSIRGLPGTSRTASPSFISSPNRNDRLNENYRGPESVAPNRRMEPRDPVTGRALEPERVALPAPRFKLPPQPRINSLD